jgi:hypothetical protein
MLSSWPDVQQKLEADPDIMARVKNSPLHSRAGYCEWSLRADTLAARLTGQPRALESAITKVKGTLDRIPQRRAQASTLWFVEPLVVGPFMRSGTEAREALTGLRLENLARIEAGRRPDFSELRDGRPVVGPKGWR